MDIKNLFIEYLNDTITANLFTIDESGGFKSVLPFNEAVRTKGVYSAIIALVCEGHAPLNFYSGLELLNEKDQFRCYKLQISLDTNKIPILVIYLTGWSTFKVSKLSKKVRGIKNKIRHLYPFKEQQLPIEVVAHD